MDEKTTSMEPEPSIISKTGLNQVKDRTKIVLTYYFITAVVESLIVVLIYLRIPTDPKNIFLFGYSKSRIFLISLFLLIALISIWGTILLWRNSKWEEKTSNMVNAWVDEYGLFIPVMIFLFGIVILSPYVFLLIKGPIQGSLLRLFPLILFAISRTVQTLIVILVLLFANGKQQNGAIQNTYTIPLSVRKILVVLAVFAFLLIMASLSGELMSQILPWDQTIWRYKKRFDLNLEHNFPTYFSSMILLFSSILLGIIAVIKQRAKDYYSVHWVFLACFFLILSIDEAVSLHELASRSLTQLFNPTGLFYFSWVIIAIPLIILLTVAYRKFLFHLPVKSRIYFFSAAALYITGSLVFEMLEGRHVEMYGDDTPFYILLSSAEEILEIFGILIFIYALLGYIKSNFPEILVRLEK